MIKQDFNFQGALHGVIWSPKQGEIHSVLQITHGMTEHIGRYEELAELLTSQGVAVAGFDLRGHGENAGDSTYASFGEGGWKCTLEDMHNFYTMLREQYPMAKHYMLGFSLGSFLLREYLSVYAEDSVDGAIIMGTGHQPAAVLSIIITIVKGQIKKVGWDQTTPLVKELSFGTYNKKFQPNRTVSDWLCADETSLDDYIADPLCRNDISAGLFADLLEAMKRTGRKSAYKNWKKALPVLLISGKDDPVGDMGKGVQVVYQQMQKNGMQQVEMQLYDGARHDLLHEVKSGNAKKSMEKIAEWMGRI